MIGADILSSALKAGSTLPPLATKTALTTLLSMPGKASIRVFCACCCGDMGRGGFGGGMSVVSSVKRTAGLGDLEGGGDVTVSWVEEVVASLSSSKSSSRAVVGLSGGYNCQYGELHDHVGILYLLRSRFLRHGVVVKCMEVCVQRTDEVSCVADSIPCTCRVL